MFRYIFFIMLIGLTLAFFVKWISLLIRWLKKKENTDYEKAEKKLGLKKDEVDKYER